MQSSISDDDLAVVDFLLELCQRSRHRRLTPLFPRDQAQLREKGIGGEARKKEEPDFYIGGKINWR